MGGGGGGGGGRRNKKGKESKFQKNKKIKNGRHYLFILQKCTGDNKYFTLKAPAFFRTKTRAQKRRKI